MIVTTPATIITTAKSCNNATPCMLVTFRNRQTTGQRKACHFGGILRSKGSV